MIHSRDAFQETYDVLKQFPNITVYIHCWWYWEKEVQMLLKTFPNLYIWFCWNITYKSAENLRESLKILPIEKLLVETDAPYLSPQGHRWEINEPKNVIVIWKYISELLRIEEETLWKQVCTNFFNLYKNK
jgi:TatD DNase family protein